MRRCGLSQEDWDWVREYRMIIKLRRRLMMGEEEISDKELLNLTQGTFLRASCELQLALEDLRDVIRETWVVKKLARKG